MQQRPLQRQRMALTGMKWRFLSDTVTQPSLRPSEPPLSNEARRRVAYLERALASSNELEAQFESFLLEASRGAAELPDGISLDWASTSALLHLGDVHGAVAPEFVPSSDQIPSDPREPSKSAPRGGRRALGGAAGDAPADGAAHADEDAEVARVQQPADEGGGGEGEEPRASPSPVIIWRHAAPVKIATNLPPDLLPPTPLPGQPLASPATPPRRAPSGENALAVKRAAAVKAAAPSAASNELKERRAAVAKRMQYGAWYLPTDQWATRAQDATADGGRAPPKAGRGASSFNVTSAGASADAELRDEEQNLADTIPKLYSSRMYKDYLKSMRHTRMPHYLTHVEDSPKHANLSSRRGNIPLLDTSGTEGGADAS